jgi:hypothetical protein
LHPGLEHNSAVGCKRRALFAFPRGAAEQQDTEQCARGGAAAEQQQLGIVSNQITNNSGTGIAVFNDSYLFDSADTVQNNGIGIRAQNNSVVRADTMTISNNGSDGVRLESGAALSFVGDDMITSNGGNGVAIHDLAFASFAMDGSDNVSGNQGQPDVACYPQYSATRGAGTVGGTTNCQEPSSPEKRK